MKSILALLVGVMLAFGGVVQADNDKAERILNAINKGEMQVKLHNLVTPEGYAYRHAEKEVNTAEHDSFKWIWNWHYVDVFGEEMLFMSTRNYKELVSPGRQYVEWLIQDYDADGIVDNWQREYVILQEDKYDDGESLWFHIMPNYPEGFRAEKWFEPTKEEAQEIYNKELDFWVNLIGRKI